MIWIIVGVVLLSILGVVFLGTATEWDWFAMSIAALMIGSLIGGILLISYGTTQLSAR